MYKIEIRFRNGFWHLLLECRGDDFLHAWAVYAIEITKDANCQYRLIKDDKVIASYKNKDIVEINWKEEGF